MKFFHTVSEFQGDHKVHLPQFIADFNPLKGENKSTFLQYTALLLIRLNFLRCTDTNFTMFCQKVYNYKTASSKNYTGLGILIKLEKYKIMLNNKKETFFFSYMYLKQSTCTKFFMREICSYQKKKKILYERSVNYKSLQGRRSEGT